jgi:3-oxoacyl-[acyl-carrier protein] reductase
MELRGKACLLTGCASGIGKHLSGVLARAGARVMMTDIDEAGLAKAASGLGGEVRQQKLDVRSAEDWDAAVAATVAAFGRLDLLFNVAGVSHSAYIHEAEPARIAFHLDINLKGVMLGSHYAAKVMVQQRGGQIVNIASLAGLCPVPGMSLYSASKFGVRGFSLAIADELAPHGVGVSVICPDAVATPMLDHEALEPEAALSFSGNRILTVEDIEHAIFRKALGRGKREVIVPGSMAPLSRLVTAFPGALMPLLPIFRKRGVKNRSGIGRALGRSEVVEFGARSG